MSPATRFLLYNLLPAMVAGAFVWALVHAGVHLLRIRHGKLRLCLYMAPLIKSTLVLVGMTIVLRWPRDVFEGWRAGALPPQTVAPILVVLTGLVLIARSFAVRRSEARSAGRSYLGGSALAAAGRGVWPRAARLQRARRSPARGL